MDLGQEDRTKAHKTVPDRRVTTGKAFLQVSLQSLCDGVVMDEEFVKNYEAVSKNGWNRETNVKLDGRVILVYKCTLSYGKHAHMQMQHLHCVFG